MKKFLFVFALVFLSACNPNNEANSVMYMAPGRHIVDLIKCMGPPDRQTKEPVAGYEQNVAATEVYEWTFTETPGATSSSVVEDAASLLALPITLPLEALGSAAGSSTSAICKAVASVQNGIVVDFQFSGNNPFLMHHHLL